LLTFYGSFRSGRFPNRFGWLPGLSWRRLNPTHLAGSSGEAAPGMPWLEVLFGRIWQQSEKMIAN
jgi:hypothetical protein